jgi:DnaJ-class molecular chaperone
MKNPYTILEVSQDADKAEIKKAQMFAMKKKELPLQEIAVAARQLLDPAKRLAADFMFPSQIRVKRIQTIQSSLSYKEINVKTLNENAFDSLK